MAQALVFDLDETLLDRKGSLDVYARTLRTRFESGSLFGECEFVELFHQLDGNGRVPREEFFAALSSKAFAGVRAEEIGEHFRATAWNAPILFERVFEVLETFKANDYAIGVVTNGGSHSQNAKLNNTGLVEHLDAYIISDEFGAKKPNPEIYAEIARRLGVAPEESWFIGDDPISDVWGPAQSGFNAAWIERYLPWPESTARCYKHRLNHVSALLRTSLEEDLG